LLFYFGADCLAKEIHIPTLFITLPSRPNHPLAQRRIEQQADDRGSQLSGIASGKADAVASDDFRQSAGIGRHHGNARRKGFQHHPAGGLAARRRHQQVQAGKRRGGTGRFSGELNASSAVLAGQFGDPLIHLPGEVGGNARSDQPEARIGKSVENFRDRVQQIDHAFIRMDPSNHSDHRSDPRSDPGRIVRRHRGEPHLFHAVVDDRCLTPHCAALRERREARVAARDDARLSPGRRGLQDPAVAPRLDLQLQVPDEWNSRTARGHGSSGKDPRSAGIDQRLAGRHFRQAGRRARLAQRKPRHVEDGFPA